MSTIRTPQVSFAGGEIAPELYGRIDLESRQTGVSLARNFIALPHGPLQNRAGFQHIAKTRYSTRKARLVRFEWSADQTVELEFGHQYIRFHSNGATILEAPQNITAATAANPGVFTCAAHGYSNGNWIFIRNAAGMVSLKNRFWEVRNVTANTFTLRDIYSGVDLNTTALPAFVSATAERVYEVATSYLESELFDLHYSQDADVITITHPAHAPAELRRVSATNWTVTTPTWEASLAAPAGVGVVNVGGMGGTPITHTYVVTALTANGLEESVASASANVANDLTLAGHSNTVSWLAVAGASRYKIYKEKNGVYGYIGTAGGLTFSDDNIIPDTTDAPPEFNNPFPGAGDYPSTVTFFEQRRCFAGTDNQPQTVVFTRTGTDSNFTASVPLVASDAFSVTIKAREQNRVRHLVPLQDLIALTVGGEWRIFTGNGEPLAPASATVRVQGYTGANNVQPVVTNRNIVYAQVKGGRIREIGYNWENQAYNSDDITLLSPHLVDRHEIVDLAYGRGPVPTIWAVRDDGVLLSCTYLPEQKVRAWAQHATDGVFESVCCVSEGAEDILYAVVKRTIGGNEHRFVERLHERRFAEVADGFFVDAGLAYSGSPQTTFTGLWHLEGKTVVALADGGVVRSDSLGNPLVVANGAITIPHAASKACVGLPYLSDLRTLPLAFQAQGGGQGMRKNVVKVFLRVHESRGVFAGPDTNNLYQYKSRTTEDWGTPPGLISDEIEMLVENTWSNGGEICIRQADPLPLTICSMTLQVAVGG